MPDANDDNAAERTAEIARLMAALDMSDFPPSEAYPFVAQVMEEDDANDPLLDSYQVYRG